MMNKKIDGKVVIGIALATLVLGFLLGRLSAPMAGSPIPVAEAMPAEAMPNNPETPGAERRQTAREMRREMRRERRERRSQQDNE